jgi:DNA-directed RNA polymerase specialized sigma subunit
MDRKDIKLILKNPYKDILDYVLSIVNLSEKELQVVTILDIKENTEEYASNELNLSIRHISRIRKSAYDKLDKSWSNNSLIKVLIKMLKEE